MPAYDVQFTPPAPVAQVTLLDLDTGSARLNVPMLLDTGSDVSLVPQAAISRLGIAVAPDRQYELVAFDGTVSYAPIVQLELRFCGRSFRGQFLLIDEEWGFLGRNVLNAVPLLLDGPHLTWDEYRSR